MVIATGRGFSLAELLISLAIFGLLAGLALPGWNRIQPSFNLSSSARLIQSELHSIKIRSVAENVNFRLIYSGGGTNIDIQRDGKTWAIKPLAAGVRIAKPGMVIFSPRGTANGDRVRLISSDGLCQQVVVSQTGRVRTCKTNCGKDC